MASISGYPYEITISNDDSGEALTDYPVKISLSAANVSSHFLWSNNGADLRFANAAGTALDYWIEEWDASGKTAEVWVEVDSIADGTDTKIYMAYGDASLSAGSSGSETFSQFGISTESLLSRGTPYELVRVQNSNTKLTLHQDVADGELHPNVIYFPQGKDGYKYWMFYTPYGTGQEAFEDVWVERSNDGITWVATGINNPVIINGGGGWKDSFIADPDVIYVELYDKFFCAYVGTDGTDYQIGFAYSHNGKKWNDLGVLIDASEAYEKDDGGDKAIVHPSLWFDEENETFNIWYTADNAQGHPANGMELCHATFTWNDTTNATVDFTRNTNNPVFYPAQTATMQAGIGHVDVWYDPDFQSFFMYCVQGELNRVDSDHWSVALYRSGDKENWAYLGRAIRPLAQLWGNRFVYRTCVMTQGNGEPYKEDVDGVDRITVFYSCANRIGTYTPAIGIAYAYQSQLMYALDTDIWSALNQVGGAGYSSYGSEGGIVLWGGGTEDQIVLKGDNGHSHGHALRCRGVLSDTSAASQICMFGWFNGVDESLWTKANQLQSGHGGENFGCGDDTNFGIDDVTGVITVDSRQTWEIQRFGDAANPSTKLIQAGVDLTASIPNSEVEDYTGNRVTKLYCRDYENTCFLIMDWMLVRKIIADPTKDEPSVSAVASTYSVTTENDQYAGGKNSQYGTRDSVFGAVPNNSQYIPANNDQYSKAGNEQIGELK